MNSRNTDHDWKVIADSEPYWGVVSADRFRRAALDGEAMDAFFETGERRIASLFAAIPRFLGQVRLERALDFGCGVGRLAIPLARRVPQVIGVDVTPRMVELARQNAERFGVGNVAFQVTGDRFDEEVPGEFDLVNTLIVLQHIPPERGLKVFERLILKTRIGGVFSLQLTYARAGRHLVHEAPLSQYYRRDANGFRSLMASGVTPPEGTVTMYDYDLNAVMAIVSAYAAAPVLCFPTRDDDHLGVEILAMRAR
jgi:SAM-dependent methyltransferase